MGQFPSYLPRYRHSKSLNFSKKRMDQSTQFFVMCGVFDWLYLIQYWHNKHQTSGFCKTW